MNKTYRLCQARFSHPVGTICYEFIGCTYGLVNDDEMRDGTRHTAVTLNQDGSGPFFTVPVASLVEIKDSQRTFESFRVANVTRANKWHTHGIESWSDSDWLVAIMGELGELAGLIKMRNRERDGLPGNKFSPTDKQVADEAADVFTYLDLFCARNGIDLSQAVVNKFNEISERVGFPDRL